VRKETVMLLQVESQVHLFYFTINLKRFRAIASQLSTNGPQYDRRRGENIQTKNLSREEKQT